MKKYFLFGVFFFLSFFTYSQSIIEIDSVKIYLIDWNKKYKYAIGIENFKKYYQHSFQTDGTDFKTMFLDYTDCVNKLNSKSSITKERKTKLLNSLVEFQFSNDSIVSVFFDIKGNYYFNGEWHQMNNELYYLLFKYFSNEIIPLQILDSAKCNFKDVFWNKE